MTTTTLFFYNFSFQQYQMAYNSYKNNNSSINDLIKTLFTVITLIVGYAHYLMSVKEYNPLVYVYVSLIIFGIIVFYGLFIGLPKEIPYLNPKIVYDKYFELNMAENDFNMCLAQLISNITDDTITIHNRANALGNKLYSMQFFSIIGLFFLVLSIIEYII